MTTKTRMTRKRQRTLDEALDNVLLYMTYGSFVANELAQPTHRLAPTYFNRAEPWILRDAFDPLLGSNEDEFFVDVHPKDLSKPLDISIVSWLDTDEKSERTFVLARARAVQPKEVRGKTTVVLPHMLEVADAYVDMQTGVATTSRAIFGLVKPRREDGWIEITAPFIANMSSNRQGGWSTHTTMPGSGVHSRTIQVMHGIAFTRRYQWVVTLAWEGGPSLLFPTDPVGVRELLRLRDIPNGKNRRTALRHWVRDHYRQRRDDPAALSYVRKHLRGIEHFSWNGLVGTYEASEYDRELNASEAQR